MSNSPDTQQAGRKRPPDVRGTTLSRMLWFISSVRIGLGLLVLIALYAALGNIPLGPLFPLLGGSEWQPASTVRHLPWIDLREREYFATPLFAALLAGIVVNMTLATVLRIRWELRKVGVLLTHTGVVVLAIGAGIASRSPLNATIVVFADEPATTAIDRSRTIIRTGGLGSDGWRVDEFLPRYADFGTPWADVSRDIELPDGHRVTGFAHSARLVPRLVEDNTSNSPGWQIVERLRTGESRTLAMVAGSRAHSRAALSDGTVILVADPGWKLSASVELLHSAMQGQGAGVIRIGVGEADSEIWLPLIPGEMAALNTPSGLWRAEFLDRSEFVQGTPLANFSLKGPGFPRATVFAGPWDPDTAGSYSQAENSESMELAALPAGITALYMDFRVNALLLSTDDWLLFQRGELRNGQKLREGDNLQLTPMTRIEVERFIEHAAVENQLERVPFVEDAQLLADPRLGSFVRLSSSAGEDDPGEWIGFDEQAETRQPQEWMYGPATLDITDLKVSFLGFKAELFRRGSIPKDFLIDLELEREGASTMRTLSLNDPVRTTMNIGGHDRRVQLSLIGWDSQGWEGSRADEDERFEGTRFVILAINQREGVSTALYGGALILVGAAYSIIFRLRRSRTVREVSA